LLEDRDNILAVLQGGLVKAGRLAGRSVVEVPVAV
jgi:hypothetical protein